MSTEAAMGAITGSTTAAMNGGTAGPDPDGPPSRRPGPTAQLLRVQSREFVRERRGFVTSLLLPLGLATLFFGMAFVVPESGSGPGFSGMVVPLVIFLAVSTSPLMATAASLADARARGTLRLLGTTPVGRARLILTHVPARLGLVLAQIVLLITVGIALGLAPAENAPALFGVALLGVALFGSIGYLLGGLSATAESAWNVSVFFQMVPFLLSGLVLPLNTLPAPLDSALSWLPTSFFADLLLGLMPHGGSTHPVWLSVMVVAGTAVLVTALAVRLFRWDQGEPR
ncbi:ABC transporter permease [Nocardiopsis xinjiangensis]|uniref:ABC transporter permease n=1 Tax=Nocardiopsis xinjiangensis TaxID=124285 RepID=UPI00034981C9|nr:ABC transporter permease [Nocardiopsis xinjiangensis]